MDLITYPYHNHGYTAPVKVPAGSAVMQQQSCFELNCKCQPQNCDSGSPAIREQIQFDTHKQEDIEVFLLLNLQVPVTCI